MFFKNIIKQKHSVRLSEHSKLVLIVSIILMTAGTILLLFIEELNNSKFLSIDRILTASFQAISSSTTTGFNSVDIGLMQPLSLFVIIILMFIGASPGGTGGGIKTSTVGIIISFIKKVLSNRNEVSIFKRSVDEITVSKSITIAALGIFYLIFVSLTLSITEHHSLLQIIFEATSALGTVGLSTGITSKLSTTGKLLIIMTMLIGRVGPLAVGYSLIGNIITKKYSYPNGEFLIG